MISKEVYPFWVRVLPRKARIELMKKKEILSVLENSGWLVLDRIIRLILGVLVGAWVARYLGPERYGELAYVLVYLAFFMTITNLSLDGAIVRDIAQEKDKANVLLGSAFILRLTVGCGCWLIAVSGMIYMYGAGDDIVMLTMLAGGALVFQSADTVDLWFQSQSQSKRTVVAKLSAYLIANGVKVALIIKQAPLIAFAGIMLLEALLSALSLWISYAKYKVESNWFFDAKTSLYLIKESWPFVLAGLANIFQARIECIIIESALGKESLGQYFAALKFIELFDVIGMIFAISIFPKLAGKGISTSGAAIKKTYVAMFGLYLMSLPIMGAAWWTMGVVYGEAYALAQTIFISMMLRPLLTYLGVTRNMAMRIDRKSNYAMACSIVGAIVAAICAYKLIPVIGIFGASVSSAASYFVSNFLMDAIFYRSNFKNIITCYKV